MNFTSDLFIILILVGPIFIVLGFLMLKFPPRSVNSMVGYRTKQSKSSQNKWDFAQTYSAVQLIKSGIIGSVIAFAAILPGLEEYKNAFVGLAIVLLLVIFPFYKTEKAIKLKFGK